MNRDSNLLVCLKLSLDPEMYKAVESLIVELEQENEGYVKKHHEIDYEIENTKKALENCNKALTQCVTENQKLKGIVKDMVEIWN